LVPVVQEIIKPGVTSFVFDSEVVAYDRINKCILPFQKLATRKRKEDSANGEGVEVQVILEAFDLIYLNGKPLLQMPLQHRRELLHMNFKPVEGKFQFAKYLDHQENGDTTPIEAFLQESVREACEGLMLKTLVENASYEPSKRSMNWLKLKKDYLDNHGVADSIDVVPIGAYHGRGKRTGVYGAYLLACYEPETEEFQSVCKIGTGFSDALLQQFTEEMKPLVIDRRALNYKCGDGVIPDVWFEASKVWEIRAADLSISPVHRGAIGRVDPERGIGLRFPRFIRERPDKNPENATTAEQIADMYRSQGEAQAAGTNGGDAEDDWEL
jgi:DNA ligase-1